MRAAAAAALIKVISNFRCLRLTDFLVCVCRFYVIALDEQLLLVRCINVENRFIV